MRAGNGTGKGTAGNGTGKGTAGMSWYMGTAGVDSMVMALERAQLV